MAQTDVSPERNERFIWLDSLRLAAGVSMVGLHSTSDAMGQPFTQFDPEHRIAPLLLRAVIYTARTELFLIISIFLLLMALEKRPKTYRQTIEIQSRRLLIPFIFWTVFYAFYNLIKANFFGYFDSAFAELSSPIDWLGFLVLGSVKYHMHFIPTLFGLILLYPLFRLAQKFPILGFAILICLIVKRDLDGFIYQQFWGTDALPYIARAIKIATYAGYGLLAGAFLGLWRQTDARLRVQFVPILVFFGLLLFTIKLVATWKTVQLGRWPFEYTAGYWADFLMPAVLFAIAMALSHKRWPQFLSDIAPYSFGIYLCHPIFLDLAEIWLRDQGLMPMIQVTIKITFAVTLTSLFVVLLKKTRVLAFTVGLGPFPQIHPPKNPLVKGH